MVGFSPISPMIFLQYPPIYTIMQWVIPRKPELLADTAYYFMNVLTTDIKPSFTYFYFRSTNPTNSRQLILEQQVICLIIKTPLANGKVCTCVFYLKATQIINLQIRTKKGMKNTLCGSNSPNFLKIQFSRRTLWNTQTSKHILIQAGISFLHYIIFDSQHYNCLYVASHQD